MDTKAFPTKGNLIANKNTLALAKQGYELMDKKRNVLISEIVEIINQVKDLKAEINFVFEEAYRALEIANVQMGYHNVHDMALAVPEDKSVKIYIRSVMDAEVPTAVCEPEGLKPAYPFYKTSEMLDEARLKFNKVKELAIRMAALENAAFRLSTAINKAQKRANALQNITIPYYNTLVRNITSSLEEKEREEFIRLKVIKRTNQKKEGGSH